MEENEKPQSSKKKSSVLTLQKIWAEIHFIKNALLGDEYNREGVMKRLHNVEKQVTALNDFKNRIIWTATGVSLAIGSAFTFINYIMNLKK